MGAQNTPAMWGGPGRARWILAAMVVAGWAGTGRAEPPGRVLVAPLTSDAGAEPGAAPGSGIRSLGDPAMMMSGGVVPASCSSCGSGGGGYAPVGPGTFGWGKKYGPDACLEGGCGDEGCGENGCIPGRQPCVTCEGHSRIGRIFCAFHNAICCPDPCYEPRWKCGANAALFVDYARPVTQMRLRWDAGQNLIQPDRAEYFWARQGGKGPGLRAAGVVPRGETGVDYHELNYYQEFATDRFGFFINVPYRSLQGEQFGGAAGFGDLTIGTKSMLLDSELLQFTFQFATTIPVGPTNKGIGVGHVSLTPSLLTALKLYPDTYYQSQIGYWIPISASSVDVNGASSSFSGGVFQLNQSVNHVLCRPLPDTALVGSFESMLYAFTAGRYTDPVTGNPLSANGQVYFSVGPGVRLCVCDKIDFGFGIQFAVTNPHFAEQLYRTEFRWRF